MYNDFFGFREAPFSIAPDPRYLYLSERHKEALAHLMYGVQGQGGFIVITGEVGTGKTTVCRCFLDSVPDHVDIALVLNPKLSARELLASICDELQLRYPAGASIKRLVDLINSHLLSSHGQGRHTVLVIDEAQNLSADVLEQLRLLTNLETGEKKLLQIVLLGQPELQEMLAQRELRQLSQRITARYHLDALGREELPSYVRYRLSVAGSRQVVFQPPAVKTLFRLSRGIPRLVNLVADRALLGAYAQGQNMVDARTVRQAGREVLGARTVSRVRSGPGPWRVAFSVLAVCGLAVGLLTWGFQATGPGFADSSLAVAGEPEREGTVERRQPAQASPGDEIDHQSDDTQAPAETPGAAISDTGITTDTSGESARLLAGWSPSNSNTLEAYRQLFQLWGLEFDAARFQYACEFAEQQGLRCLHRQGNWRSLEQLDRPAILRLYNDEGTSYHITLLRLEGDRALVALGGEQHSLPRAAIDAHWLGDYSVLWRLPPYESAPAGQTGKSRWLADAMQSLRKHYGVDQKMAQELSQAPLEEQVVWFQRRSGLVPDGIPGTVTLIRINSELDPTVPRLSASPESKHLARQD